MAEFGDRFFRELVAKDRRDLRIPGRYFDKAILLAIGTKPVLDVITEGVRVVIWCRKDDPVRCGGGHHSERLEAPL